MFGGLLGFGGGGGGFFANPGRFDHRYQVYPVSFMQKDELEKGNKIILPQSALDHLARLNISYPMLFECSNTNHGRRTHCGVQEFIAEEGTCYLPYWMMCNLLLTEGDFVRVVNTSLPKGTFVKLQPVSSDFLQVHNPRAVLEISLRNFATLTVGDCVVIDYNGKKFEIEIKECRPENAISIIEADVNVDFAPPKDYVEPTPVHAPAGSGYQMKQEEHEEEPPPPEPETKMFVGAGHRIDGKTPKASPVMASSPSPQFDEFADKPWKKKIPGGVKWTEPPYSFGAGHMSGKKLGGPIPSKMKNEDLFDGKGQSLK